MSNFIFNGLKTDIPNSQLHVMDIGGISTNSIFMPSITSTIKSKEKKSEIARAMHGAKLMINEEQKSHSDDIEYNKQIDEKNNNEDRLENLNIDEDFNNQLDLFLNRPSPSLESKSTIKTTFNAPILNEKKNKKKRENRKK